MVLRILEKEYKVHVYETGPDGKLNLYSLFDYLQDIASEHAIKLGYGRNELMEKNHYWVLSRIYAEIHEWPRWGDTISLRTWPKGTESVFALRDYEAFFTDGRPVASATSSWLIIDMSTKRIQRPDATLSQYNTEIPHRDSLPRNAAKLESASGGSITPEFSVRVSDLDVNHHTNNVKYIKWITDSCDLGFVMENVPYSAEINYLAESRYGHRIVIRASVDKDDSNMLNYSVLRIPDNTELCRIRIGWGKNHQDK
jgi:acyl-ACP thioesterase